MEELKHKAGLRVAKRIIIFEITFKMLYVALSGLVLMGNFFEETFLSCSCLLASLLLGDTS